METRPDRATGRPPWPAGLLGMLALVLACEGFVARHRHVFMTPHELDWRAAGREAWGSPRVRSAEVLCFGDSMLKFGLAPRVLEDRLGRSVYSLALLDGKPASSYFLLRRALHAGARPKVVVVDFQPECLLQTGASLLENRHWKALVSPGEAWDLARTYRDPAFFGRAMTERYLPSATCRAEIRWCVRLGLMGHGSPWPEENEYVGRNREANRGAVLLSRRPGNDGRVPDAIKPAMYSDQWAHRPEHTGYVRRFLRLAAEAGIPVVWVLPPNVPEIEQTRREIGLHDRYTRFVRALQAKHPGLHVVDGRFSGYGPDAFVDQVHLDRRGAVALSLDVAETLRRLLDGTDPPPAWAALPPFRERPDPVALPDVDLTHGETRMKAALQSLRR